MQRVSRPHRLQTFSAIRLHDVQPISNSVIICEFLPARHPVISVEPAAALQVCAVRVRGPRVAGDARARVGASACHTPHPPAAHRRHPADPGPPLALTDARHPLPQRELQVRCTSSKVVPIFTTMHRATCIWAIVIHARSSVAAPKSCRYMGQLTAADCSMH